MSSDDEEKQDDSGGGSVWSSYSDLFMTIAIVFLVMFVFTMLQSQVEKMKSTLEQEQQKKQLEAKIPEKMKKRTEAHKKLMVKSIDDIEQKNKLIAEKMKEFMALNKDLSQQKKVYNQILKDQLKQEAIIAQSRKKFVELRKEFKKRRKELDREKALAKQEIEKIKKEKENEIAKIQLESAQKINKVIVEKTNEFNKVIAEKNKVVDKVQIEKEQIERNNKNLAKKVNSLEVQKRRNQEEIEGITVAYESKIDLLQNDIKNQKGKFEQENLNLKTEAIQAKQNIKTLMKEAQNRFSQQNSKAHRKVSSLKQKLANSLASHGKQIQKIQGTHSKETNRLHAQVSKLQGNLKNLEGKLSDSENEYGKLQGEARLASQQTKSLNGQLGKLNSENKGLHHNLQGFEKKVSGLHSSITDLKGQLAINEKEIESLKECGTKSRKLASLNGVLKNKLTNTKYALNKAASRKLNIMQKILANLKANGVDVEADLQRGVITLRMDDIFNFGNNSYQLNHSARAKLKKIIPIYAEALLGEKDSAEHIAGVTITGFASPRFRRVFVDPIATDYDAYNYNLNLSVKRAEQIAKYIFSNQIGDYNHKTPLREITSVSGKSYMDPVKIDRQVTVETCGPYDCARSRRVEINFILKDNSDLIEKMQVINRNL